MVKGVNKSVIEISETGSKYFSRVILFVAPEYVEKKSKKLTAEAASVIRKIQMSSSASLRDIISAERKRKKRLLILLLSVFVGIVATALLLLLF